MRIAVCLSGQLRSWEVAIDNQRWFWESGETEVDYFLHTWNYSCDREGVSKEYIEREVTVDEYRSACVRYATKKAEFDNIKTDFFLHSDHWSSLFYSLSKSLLLKREYEIKHDFEYDLVVKSRPDVVFHPNKPFRPNYPPNNVIFSTHGGIMPREFNTFNVNDCVFVGKSRTMDLLLNLYFYRQYLINDNFKHSINVHPLGPGTLMHEFFRDYGITPLLDLGFQETLVKLGHPENLDLFKPEEFEEMEKYFRSWYHN